VGDGGGEGCGARRRRRAAPWCGGLGLRRSAGVSDSPGSGSTGELAGPWAVDPMRGLDVGLILQQATLIRPWA
jgi:hypothetical protein